MTQYAVNKRDLHELLKMLGILQQDEQILLVNNIELRDDGQEYVGILVDAVRKKNIFSVAPGELDDAELESLQSDLQAFEQFLLGEFRHVHKQLNGVRKERERRIADGLNNDGIPNDVDQKLSEVLKNLLSGEK